MSEPMANKSSCLFTHHHNKTYGSHTAEVWMVLLFFGGVMGLLNDTSTGLDPILRIPLVLGFNAYRGNIPTKAKIFTLNEN